MRTDTVLRVMIVFSMVLFGLGSVLPCDSAKSRLEWLAWHIRVFHFRNGEYPESLDTMCKDKPSCPSLMDPWSMPYMYVRLTSGYELYSNGPDRTANTEDDIVPYIELIGCPLTLEENMEIIEWRVPKDPCYVAEEVLLAWANWIRSLRVRTGRYPVALKRQIDEPHAFWQHAPYSYILNVEIDPWGEPYSYSQTPSGYVLFSNGPDRMPNTEDDVIPGIPANECRLTILEGRQRGVPASGRTSLGSIQSGNLPVTRKLQSGCGCSVREY